MSEIIEEEDMEQEKQYVGTCRFCGQRIFVKGPFGKTPTQEEIDAIATDQCVCDDALQYRLLEQRCRMLRSQIDGLHMKNTWIHDVLCEAIQPISSNDLMKVSITDGSGTTFAVTCGKTGPRLVVKGAMTTIVTPSGLESIKPDDWREE